MIAGFFLSKHRAPEVDWPTIVRNLRRSGITYEAMAMTCEKDPHWPRRLTEGQLPEHRAGETLKALHVEYCGPIPEKK